MRVRTRKCETDRQGK